MHFRPFRDSMQHQPAQISFLWYFIEPVAFSCYKLDFNLHICSDADLKKNNPQNAAQSRTLGSRDAES